MAGRKKIEVNEAMKSDARRQIVSAIEKAGENAPSITDLEKDLGINRGTLKHHLALLERAGIIAGKKFSNELGAPLRFFSKRKSYPDALGKSASIERTADIMKNKEKTLKLLGFISKNQLSKSRVVSTSPDAANMAELLQKEGYLDSIFILTEKGKRFLDSLRH